MLIQKTQKKDTNRMILLPNHVSKTLPTGSIFQITEKANLEVRASLSIDINHTLKVRSYLSTPGLRLQRSSHNVAGSIGMTLSTI